MLKRFGVKKSSTKAGDPKRQSDKKRLSIEAGLSGNGVAPSSPTSPTSNGADRRSVGATSLDSASRRNSDLLGGGAGDQAPVGPQIPIANAGGTPQEGRQLGEAAGVNDLDTVRQLAKTIPVNTLDEVSCSIPR